MTNARISRRACLRGLGCALALPFLQSLPAADPPGVKGKPPLRVAFLSIPNGVNMDHWRLPGGNKLSPTLEALQPVLKDVLILQNLRHQKANGNGDGPGDHARETGTLLTGVQLRKTDGNDIQAGVSVDQIMAQRAGHLTALPSLELGLEGSNRSGNCDSGYSCAYSSNTSWRSPTTPNLKETDPRKVYKKLFIDVNQSGDQQIQAGEIALRRSMLDLVNADAKRLHQELGLSDKRKLDEYMESVRELEQRIQRFGLGSSQPDKSAPKVDFPADDNHSDYTRIMLDLMILGFQADVTRISTFMFGNGGSGRVYKEVGATGGHHEISHHGNDPAKIATIRKIDRYLLEHFVYAVQKMSAIKESDGRSLLDHSMILYASGLGDGDRHNHDDLPAVLAGAGGGSIRSGRILNANANMCDLFLAMLGRFGTPVDRFGDSEKIVELSR
jgi:hypothetical protein